MTYQAHETAIIDAGARIGSETQIWHWVHVCGASRIGEGCSIGQNVFIGNDVVIGNRCKIQNNVSVYDAVVLEDEVFCGPSMVFTNVYNPRSAMKRNNDYEPTLVRRGATIGANATIVCGVTLGQYSFVGAGAVVTQDIKPFAIMVGVPARQIGWMSRSGERLELPKSGNAEAQCPMTGEVYRLKSDNLKLID